MDLNLFHQVRVNGDGYDLPYHPYKAYYSVLTSALGGKDDGIPRAIQLSLPYVKRHLYYLHDNPPPGRIRFFICLRCYKPYLQVLCPYL